jgi:hypothetical protein
MPSSIEFKSTAPGKVGDLTRLELIRGELQVICNRMMSRHEMYSDPHLESAVTEALSALDEYFDYDPTDDMNGEPPLSASERWTSAHQQHRALHS